MKNAIDITWLDIEDIAPEFGRSCADAAEDLEIGFPHTLKGRLYGKDVEDRLWLWDVGNAEWRKVDCYV